MKISKIFLLAFASLWAMGTASVWAVSSPGMKRLSLETGAVFPTKVNDLSSSAQMGPAGGVQYLYELDEVLGVGVQADFFHFGSKSHTLTNNDTSGQIDANSQDNAITVEVMGRCNLISIPDVTFAPYLFGGIGAAYFHQKSDGTPSPGSTWTDTNTTETRQIQDESSLGVALSIGLGVETKISKSLVLGLESAWHVFGVSKSTYGTNTIGAPTVSLRLAWRFGSLPITS